VTPRAAGVDVGGTFTDRAALGADGRITTRKVLTTPADQGEGVAASLDGIDGALDRIVHGTTVVTNLLLERSGARAVLCATDGATDLLELRRQERASLYDLAAHHPPPLIPPERVIAVKERQTPRGVELALTDTECARVVSAALALRPDVVVISLLHAYADGTHERRLAAAFRAANAAVPIVTSVEVLAEIREYERTATAVAEGYARPVVGRYLANLAERLTRAGHPAPGVMTSAGGTRPATEAAQHAASLALSGPAGGVVGAAAVMRALGIADALTIDIGGTSADAGLILAGEPLVEPGGDVAGVPIALPRVLVDTVSAGGGSIAWIDDGGALRVGPRSAGARPGPVAFSQGGTQVTVTDAQLVLGRIRADAMSGGVKLDVRAAAAALDALASKLGAQRDDIATAIIRIADAEMARALRRVSVERGVDPRRCALVAFGGGGPLHACALADAIGSDTVIVPPHAGVLSAVGLALAATRRERQGSVLRTTTQIDATDVRRECEALAEGLEGDARHWTARVRFVGQGHELAINVTPDDSGDAIATRFRAAHQRRYGFTLPNAIEVVALRAIVESRGAQAVFTRDVHESPLRGPAALALPDATLWVAAGWHADPLDIGGWRLTRGASA
jgi:N-methylhydantoinase A/oxoprolinase/acetone carboxylase beta subunit